MRFCQEDSDRKIQAADLLKRFSEMSTQSKVEMLPYALVRVQYTSRAKTPKTPRKMAKSDAALPRGSASSSRWPNSPFCRAYISVLNVISPFPPCCKPYLPFPPPPHPQPSESHSYTLERPLAFIASPLRSPHTPSQSSTSSSFTAYHPVHLDAQHSEIQGVVQHTQTHLPQTTTYQHVY